MKRMKTGKVQMTYLLRYFQERGQWTLTQCLKNRENVHWNQFSRIRVTAELQ